MNFDNPDQLTGYADRIDANGDPLAASVLRAFATAWDADRIRIDALQDENTQLHRLAECAIERLQTVRERCLDAAHAVLGSAA